MSLRFLLISLALLMCMLWFLITLCFDSFGSLRTLFISIASLIFVMWFLLMRYFIFSMARTFSNAITGIASPQDSTESHKSFGFIIYSLFSYNIPSTSRQPKNRHVFKPSIFTMRHIMFHSVMFCLLAWFACTMMKDYVVAGIAIQMLRAILEDNVETMCWVFVCFLSSLALLYILSVLDWYFLHVPNILLVVLFCISCVLLFIYPPTKSLNCFVFLGVAYAFYFVINLFSSHEIFGQGDVWAFVGVVAILKFLFYGHDEFIFYTLILASAMGLIYYVWCARRIRTINLKNEKLDTCNHDSHANLEQNMNDNFKHNQKDPIAIPFIPFLMFGFMAIGVWQCFSSSIY